MQPEIEEVVAFTVPYLVPPSGNHYKIPIWRNGRPHYIITPTAKAYYDAVAIFAQGRSVAPLDPKQRKKARYGVRIEIYLGPKQRGDFDNFWKTGLDSIVNAGVIHSDAAVDGAHAVCVVHKDERNNPRTEYTITRLEK